MDTGKETPAINNEQLFPKSFQTGEKSGEEQEDSDSRYVCKMRASWKSLAMLKQNETNLLFCAAHADTATMKPYVLSMQKEK